MSIQGSHDCMSRDRHSALGESNGRWRNLTSLPRAETWEEWAAELGPRSCILPCIQAQHLYLRVYPFWPSVLGCRMEDVQGNALELFDPTVHHSFPGFNSQWVYFSLGFTYSHLWFCRGFPGGSRYVVWGSQVHSLPSPNLFPQLHGLCLGMFAFRRQTLIFLSLQQAHSPCGSYAKKGQPVLTNIYKSHLKDT